MKPSVVKPNAVKPHILLIQPPFVQLNCPYPSLYYLRAFLEQRGFSVSVKDHSIGLFERIFCREGLERIFTEARTGKAAERADKRRRPIIERFLSEEEEWLMSIDRLTAFLKGRDREWGHLLSLANGTLPGGPRFDACLVELDSAKGGPSPDDASLLASRLLADIADFITVCIDPGFSLIRYVPSTAADNGFRFFSAVREGLKGCIMRNFYRPFLKTEWENLEREMDHSDSGGGPLLLGVTIPFPGCLAGALVCAESAKGYFGGRVITVAGGGYVNTELRFIEEEKFFDYFDYLSFDRGYGSLDAILQVLEKEGAPAGTVPLYKTIYRDRSGAIVRDNGIANNSGAGEGKGIDDEAAGTVFPDYSGLDFSRYILPVDDANPMHRLWSDGRWLKAYAAHGCYWHNCAFCDVSLDYILCFRPVDAEALFHHLTAQAQASGVRGVHLVDEACPPASLLRLALLNREAGLPLLFWGNIRFEKSFTADAAAILAAGGLIGVSAGLEVASEKGLARIGKGVNLAETVRACAAFKEAGILVHAYLIYGYWDESDGEIIDSAEILRQFFAAGLLDSAFWHKFVLTKHSRIYAEKLAGLHKALRPGGDPLSNDAAPRGGKNGRRAGNEKIFALNDLSFEGEERFDRWTQGLDLLLGSWMNGRFASPVAGAFAFKTPRPAVPPDLVPALLDNYARERDKNRNAVPSPGKQNERALFLGSRPVTRLIPKGAEIRWRRQLEDCVLRVTEAEAAQTAALLKKASGGKGMNAGELFMALETIFGSDAKQIWVKLRRQGLACF